MENSPPLNRCHMLSVLVLSKGRQKYGINDGHQVLSFTSRYSSDVGHQSVEMQSYLHSLAACRSNPLTERQLAVKARYKSRWRMFLLSLRLRMGLSGWLATWSLSSWSPSRWSLFTWLDLLPPKRQLHPVRRSGPLCHLRNLSGTHPRPISCGVSRRTRPSTGRDRELTPALPLLRSSYHPQQIRTRPVLYSSNNDVPSRRVKGIPYSCPV